MVKVVSKAGRSMVRAITNIEREIHTTPVKDYSKIVCPLRIEDKHRWPHLCWLACGLSCAAKCSRAPDLMCAGCPCMVRDENEEESETE